jgi:hypothetical protein
MQYTQGFIDSCGWDDRGESLPPAMQFSGYEQRN